MASTQPDQRWTLIVCIVQVTLSWARQNRQPWVVALSHCGKLQRRAERSGVSPTSGNGLTPIRNFIILAKLGGEMRRCIARTTVTVLCVMCGLCRGQQNVPDPAIYATFFRQV